MKKIKLVVDKNTLKIQEIVPVHVKMHRTKTHVQIRVGINADLRVSNENLLHLQTYFPYMLHLPILYLEITEASFPLEVITTFDNLTAYKVN